jgi:hypothetical protein
MDKIEKFWKVYVLANYLGAKYKNTLFIGLSTLENELIIEKFRKHNQSPDFIEEDELYEI